MRNILFLLSLLVSIVGTSQTYRPLVKEGATWVNSEWRGDPQYYPDLIYYKIEQHFFQGDTLINGLVYKKLMQSMYDSSLGPKAGGNLNSLWREDTNGRVFVYPINLLTSNTFFFNCVSKDSLVGEYLIYDFGMNVGDTIYHKAAQGDSTFYTLQKIDTVNISGVPTRAFYFTRELEFGDDTWFEGIGSINGIFSPFCGGGIESGYILGCYFDSTIYYRNDTTKSCQFFGLKSNRPGHFRYYPNPTYGEFSIDFDKEYSEIEMIIKDMQGRIVLKSSYQNTSTINAEIEGIPGIYLVQLRSENEYLGTFKIVKQ